MGVIFPDIEKVLVATLQNALDARSEPYAADVVVATIKPASDVVPYPQRIVVIRCDGGPQLDHVRKLERIGVSIWAGSYADASALARLVEALSKQLTNDAVKLIDVILSPVRVAEESQEERRYMTLEVITKGINLT